MNYFSELLDSYSKLKKRKYKLTFLSEAGEDDLRKQAEVMADAVVQNEKVYRGEQQGKEATAGSEDLTFVYSTSRGKINTAIMGPSGKVSVGGKSNGQVGTWAPGPNDDERLPQIDKSSDGWNKLVQHFLDRLEGGEAEAILKQENKTVEGSVRGTPYEELSEYFKVNVLDKILSAARDGILNVTPGVINTLVVKGNPQEGSSSKGILGKIQEAEIRVVNEEGLSESSTEPMSVSMAKSVSDNFTSVALFPSVPEENKEEACQDILKKVGFYKNNLILFGDSPKELVVIGNKSDMNQLMKIGIDSIKDRCKYDEKSFTRIAGSEFSPQEKNAVKGVVFEAIHVAAGLMVQGKYEEARSLLAKELKTNAKILESIRRERGDRGLGFDEAWDKIVQDELLSALSSEEELKKYLIDELSLALPFHKFMDADSVEGVGLVVATGGREDIEFLYEDEIKAEGKAEQLGVKLVERQTKKGLRYVIGVGLKRLEKIRKAKFGELNSIGRILSLMGFGSSEDDSDKNLDKGFKNHITENLYGGNESRQLATINYAEDLEGRIGATASLFLEDKVYSSGNKIKRVGAGKAAESLFESIKKKLGYSELRRSAFNKTLFTTDQGSAELKKFVGDTQEAKENRSRLAEQVSRLDRKKQLQRDVEAGSRPAQDYIMHMCYLTGANARDMTQLISDDTGEVLAVRHNDIINTINAADDRKIEFSDDGTTIKISGDGHTIYLKQERTDGPGGTSKTRTLLEVPKSTLEAFAVNKNFNPTKSTKEEITKMFIQGQIKLLEGILNQSSDNLLP